MGSREPYQSQPGGILPGQSRVAAEKRVVGGTAVISEYFGKYQFQKL